MRLSSLLGTLILLEVARDLLFFIVILLFHTTESITFGLTFNLNLLFPVAR
jgi:hypothetical protein